MLKPFLMLAASVLMATAMWLWVQDVAIPRQQADEAAQGSPRGNLSDLYPRWLGARELLLHGRDPYSAEITKEIQTGYYGRPLDPARPHDPKDQQAFAYPVYVAFLLAPSVGAPFPVVQRVFVWLLLIATVITVPLWMGALGWRVPLIEKLIWMVLVIGSFPAIQAMKLQQLTMLVAAFMAAALFLLVRGRLSWAGILLALAMIKPQLAALPALWFCIWVIGDWRGRRRVFWAFAASMAALVLGGEFLLPGWIGKFRAASTAYYAYTGGGRSVLDVMLTPMWGRIASAVLVAILLALLWRVRRQNAESLEFQQSMGLVFATTLVVIPMFAPYNQLLLIPALLLIVRDIGMAWKKSKLTRFLICLTGVSIFWPWMAAAAMVVTRAQGAKVWAWPIYTSFAIPVTVLALVLTGWATKPFASKDTNYHEGVRG